MFKFIGLLLLFLYWVFEFYLGYWNYLIIDDVKEVVVRNWEGGVFFISLVNKCFFKYLIILKIINVNIIFL